ncbi:GntR family transcriptional regulator [Methylobacterium oryzisoli]|uniref:GntR family transcriptional regulator n=1 Tax=Methylobacterium oryzisoli TaxID=3385502 RepID=UPI0038917DC3
MSTLTQRLAGSIRDKLIAGELKPGERLSETALSASLKVSRNTLREVFRILTMEGLLFHEPNRGVFVSVPSVSSIIDIYRIRRIVECRALAGADPNHPAVGRMRRAVETAIVGRASKDWASVGSANMLFHAAIVELADSRRLSVFYAQVAAELRLCFGMLEDQEFLHASYVDQNANILAALEAGRPAESAEMLDAYLTRSERTILAAFERKM